MLWRVQTHASAEQLMEDVMTAFPDLLLHFPEDERPSPSWLLEMMIESRFIKRFLQFWGFVTVDPKRFYAKEREPLKIQIQPLLTQTFQFTIK